MAKHHEIWKYIIYIFFFVLKPETWGYTTVMFPYNCGTIPHSFEKGGSLKHNLNSSTRSVSIRKLRKFPGVFKQVWKYITSLNEFELRSAAVMEENAIHWATGKIANNIRQCSCFHLLSLPKENYMYIIYEVVCLCYIPSRQCFEEMRFFKEVQFSLQSIHFNQKVVVIYKLVVWASH